MRSKGANGVGRINVQFEVANYGDFVRARAGDLDPQKVRRQTIEGVVDPGARILVLPESVVKQLGLPLKQKTQVRFADGRTAQQREAEGAHVELLDRGDVFSALVEPKEQPPLLGR